MANQKISELPAATSLTGDELIPVVQGGVNKSATPNDIVALVPSGGGSSSGTLGAVQLSDGAGGFSSDAGVSVASGVMTASSGLVIGGSLFQIVEFDAGILQLGNFNLYFDNASAVLRCDGSISCTLLNVDTGNNIQWKSGEDLGPYLYATGDAATGVIGIGGNVSPDGASYDLGSIGAPWRTGYFGTSVVAPDVVMSSGAASVIILPTADPLVTGALWNNLGTITISAGP